MGMITFTPEAIDKLEQFYNTRDHQPKGLRISLKTKGCSGLAWYMEFIYDDINAKDEVMQLGSINVYIDPKAVLFILGSVVDYRKSELEEGFIFLNPNEKSKCGCGESFTV